MSHENSETIEMDGRHYVVRGGTAKAGKPEVLSPVFPFEKGSYDTAAEAENAARMRSQKGGGPHMGMAETFPRLPAAPAPGYEPLPQGYEPLPPGYVPLPEQRVEPPAPAAGIPPGPAAPRPAPEPDIVGRFKARLTDPREAGRLWRGGPSFGPPVLKPVGDVLRSAADFFVPGTTQEALTQAALAGIPGAGKLASAARVAAGTAAPIAYQALTAPGATLQAGVDALGRSVLGEGLGVGTRGMARLVGAGVGALRDTPAVAKVFSRVTNLIGTTPQETLALFTDDAGQKALGKRIGQQLDPIIAAAGNPPMTLPGLVAAGGPSTPLPAREAWDYITSLRRALYSAKGDPTRTAEVLPKLKSLDAADDQFFSALTGSVSPAARKALAAAKRTYGLGMTLSELLAGKATPDMTTTRLEKLVDPKLKRLRPGGMAALQETYQTMRNDFAERLDPQDLRALDRALRYEPWGWDVPGRPLGLNLVGTRFPVQLPTLPVRTGRTEPIGREAAAAARQVGAGLADLPLGPRVTLGQATAALTAQQLQSLIDYWSGGGSTGGSSGGRP